MPAITALAIVENKGSMVEVIGYDDGRVDLSISSTASTSPKTVILHDKEPAAVTAITVTNPENGYVKVIIGFSNALLLVIGVNIKSSTPQIKDTFGKIVSGVSAPPAPSITGIGIINQYAIAVALSNKKIRIFTFTPSLIKNQGKEATISPHTLEPIISCPSDIKTTAILPISLPGTADIWAIYVCVLTTNNNLYLYHYRQDFNYIPTTRNELISDKASKLATAACGSSRIVYTTTDNNIWQVDLMKDQKPEQIDKGHTTFTPEFIPTISAMASDNANFCIKTMSDRDETQPQLASSSSWSSFSLFGSTPPPTTTALAIIEGLQGLNIVSNASGAINFHSAPSVNIIVEGRSDGNVIFTNTATNAKTELSKSYLPTNQPAVTAITTLKSTGNDYAIVIIGFSNACYLIIKVSHNGSTIEIHNQDIRKDLSQSDVSNVSAITGIGILSKTHIAIALNNNTIEIIGFDQDLECIGGPNTKSIALNNPQTMKCPSTVNSNMKATAILSITSEDDPTVKLYVLFDNTSLYFYEYNKDSEAPKRPPVLVANSVAKIVTPAAGSSLLVYTTTDGTIWQKALGEDKKQLAIPSIPNISAIALSTKMLYYCTTDAPNNVQQKSLP